MRRDLETSLFFATHVRGMALFVTFFKQKGILNGAVVEFFLKEGKSTENLLRLLEAGVFLLGRTCEDK